MLLNGLLPLSTQIILLHFGKPLIFLVVVWYVVLTADLLRALCRMVGRRDEQSSEAMIDVTYRQSDSEREVVAVLQKLYMCASVEFLMAVADFFLQALPQSPTPTAAPADRLPLKLTTDPRSDTKTGKTQNLKPARGRQGPPSSQ